MPNRNNYVGGSDAKKILDGDWHTLYQIKKEIVPAEDLSNKFNVQLGIYTEPFHAAWLNAHMGYDLEAAVFTKHIDHPRIAGTVDFINKTDGFPLDAKHTNERSTEDSLKKWYLPQMAHYCNVYGADHIYLSAIMGNKDPVVFKWTPDPDYLSNLLELELQFWWHVANDSPPEIVPTAKLARTRAEGIEGLKVNDLRTVTMQGNNEWGAAADIYKQSIGVAAAFDSAKKALKLLVEDDVREASGNGVTIKRDARGSLRITEDKS